MKVGTATVIQSDARCLPLRDDTVDLIVTSPPYFSLRSYRDGGEHFEQIGSEATPQDFVDALSACMVEWWRVLKPSGSVWVNLGDKYAGSGGHNNSNIKADPERGPKSYNKDSGDVRAKSLMGLPWRFALAQIDAGWLLRAEVIWDKTNAMPESVTDRVRRSHEQWFHFVKEPQYFSAIDEVREDYSPTGLADLRRRKIMKNKGQDDTDSPYSGNLTTSLRGRDEFYSPLGRVPGSVWSMPTDPLVIPADVQKELDLPDHFAAFPQEWPRRIILGWSPSGICSECGEGRSPVIERAFDGEYNTTEAARQKERANMSGGTDAVTLGRTDDVIRTFTGYACACDEPSASTTPSLILDPFGGTGTTAGVARMLGRHGISSDLSADYNRLAVWRIWHSGHFTKTERRTWSDRQGSLGL